MIVRLDLSDASRRSVPVARCMVIKPKSRMTNMRICTCQTAVMTFACRGNHSLMKSKGTPQIGT
jgi:hypothetical protein